MTNTMKKDEVIIEEISDIEVAVFLFDKDERQVLGQIDTLPRSSSFEKYKVVGEIVNDELNVFSDDEPEFDYETYSGVSLEED